MSTFNPYQPPSEQPASSEAVTHSTYDEPSRGLGGWLTFVGIGIVFTPLRMLATHVPMHIKFFANGIWTVLMTPGTASYNPSMAYLILFEMVVTSGQTLAAIYLAYLFFCKKRAFPKWFMGLAILNLAFVLIDPCIGASIEHNSRAVFEKAAPEIIRSLVYIAVWCSYMMMSKRVQATFVE